MNTLFLLPTFCRLGSIFILFSFLISGCACFPTEVRYDDSMRKYTLGKDEDATTYTTTTGGKRYTLGKDHDATAKYAFRQRGTSGQRPQIVHTKTMGQHESGMAGQTGSASQAMVGDMPLVLEVNDVLFEFDKWTIKSEFVPELDRWADFFKRNPDVTAEIHGHADSTGPTAYNQNLSERRAQAIVNYLVANGVESSRLAARGFGETQPAAQNSTKQGRQKNRRVEMSL